MTYIRSKETIWHFSCYDCKGWWSIAANDGWEPRENLYCPHCGRNQTSPTLKALIDEDKII
ncbi:uncharacterized protein METZ01_LOCUS295978 [marine metagenome]|uniref:Uncharacterized protein n=1 Tax=marine metagenome TaxID=408172 RepID=A0A382M2A4_9ZZZZ